MFNTKIERLVWFWGKKNRSRRRNTKNKKNPIQWVDLTLSTEPTINIFEGGSTNFTCKFVQTLLFPSVIICVIKVVWYLFSFLLFSSVPLKQCLESALGIQMLNRIPYSHFFCYCYLSLLSLLMNPAWCTALYNIWQPYQNKMKWNQRTNSLMLTECEIWNFSQSVRMRHHQKGAFIPLWYFIRLIKCAFGFLSTKSDELKAKLIRIDAGPNSSPIQRANRTLNQTAISFCSRAVT